MSNVEIVIQNLANRLNTKKRSIKASYGDSHDFIYVKDIIDCFNEMINETKQKEKVIEFAKLTR